MISMSDEYERGYRAALRDVSDAMYSECFEVDHEKDGMQKWDGGNWFRYKLFENVLDVLYKKFKS